MKWRYNNSAFEVAQFQPGMPDSPWGGHRKLVYGLGAAIEPERIVELGTFAIALLESLLKERDALVARTSG
jgi:hypothetical protein